MRRGVIGSAILQGEAMVWAVHTRTSAVCAMLRAVLVVGALLSARSAPVLRNQGSRADALLQLSSAEVWCRVLPAPLLCLTRGAA